MSEPRCIAQLLHYHQVERQLDFTITHGKGCQGVIIRQRPSRFSFAALLNRLKKWRGK